MKAQLLLLIVTMTMGLHAEAWGKKAPPPQLPPASTLVSSQSLQDVLKLDNATATLQDFRGQWKKTLQGTITQDAHANSGIVNGSGLVNLDLSQHTLTFDTTVNDWLPAGQNSEIRVTEKNLLISGHTIERRPELIGNKLVFSRPSFYLICESCNSHFWARDGFYFSDYYDLKLHVDNVLTSSRKKSIEAGYFKVLEKDFSFLITCFLLASDKNRMICSLTEYLKRNPLNPQRMDQALSVKYVLGFERVTTPNSSSENKSN